jgi:hypothetical protein
LGRAVKSVSFASTTGGTQFSDFLWILDEENNNNNKETVRERPPHHIMKKILLLYLPAGVSVLELLGLLLLAPQRSAGMDYESLPFYGDVDGDDDVDVDVFIDTICLEVSRVNPSSATCDNAEDRHGNACSYCVVGGGDDDTAAGAAAAVSFGLCLTQEQAAIASKNDYGMDCRTTHAGGGAPESGGGFPHDDLIGCLEHYQEGDCRQSACIWCNTQVGMGFCVTEAVADITKSCPFFDCEFGTAASAPMMLMTTTTTTVPRSPSRRSSLQVKNIKSF